MTVTLRSADEINAQKGALGISGAAKPFEGYFFGEYTTNDLRTAIGIGVDQTVHAMGLIVGGLASLVSSVASNPTAAAAGLRSGRHRDPDRRHLLEQPARS